MINDRLSLRAIHAFHAVVTLGSVAAAAEHLNVTQPAISHLLKSLEEWTGLTLFRKTGRRLELTDDGQVFFGDVASALPIISNLQESAEAIRNAKRGHVRIVAIPVVSEYLLPAMIGRFMRNNPFVEITLEVADTQRSLTLLEAGTVDLALISGVHGKGHELHADIPTRSVLIAPTDWRTESTSPIELASIQSEPFIALNKGSPFRYALDQHLARASLGLSIRAHVRTQSAIAGFVASGVGIGIVDQIVAARAVEGIRVLEFEPALRWSFHLVSRSTGTLSTSASRLATYLREELSAQFGKTNHA
jgi:DNA-binding transcriptional LysR family regulator